MAFSTSLSLSVPIIPSQALCDFSGSNKQSVAKAPLFCSKLTCSSSFLRGEGRIQIPSSSVKAATYNHKNVTLCSKNEQAESSRRYAMEAFEQRRAFKVIAGLHNFDADNVAAVVRAAEKGGATHVDIACDPELVKLALGLTRLPICVSAVEPELFVPAVEAGAHMVEIGNFDGFYKDGRTFSAEEVLDITKRTRELLPHVALSVTVPHTLHLDEQVKLAEALAVYGADIIQTEGGTSSKPSSAGVLGLVEKASPALAATYSIARAVNVPVMCSSGLSDVTVPMAMAAGAAGVGVGSAVNKLNSEIAMIAAVRTISGALVHSSSRISSSMSK